MSSRNRNRNIQKSNKKRIQLPSGNRNNLATAEEVFEVMKDKDKIFRKGDIPVEITLTDCNRPEVREISPEKLITLLDEEIQFFRKKPHQRNDNLKIEQARILLKSDCVSKLPELHALVNCPICYEKDGQFCISSNGFDPDSGYFVFDSKEPKIMSLDEAKKTLLSLFEEFEFVSPNDKSRAVGMFLTPALCMGGFIRGNVPISALEADSSQTGKTYLAKMLGKVYGREPTFIAYTKGSSGSLEESLSACLIEGKPFVGIDNVRGSLNSPILESFLTSGEEFKVKVPYRKPTSVNPRKHFLLLTSNGLEFTEDLVNRSSIIRLRRRKNRCFRSFPESGDLLEHVGKNQHLYLGAIMSIIKEWVNQGKPTYHVNGHDFQAWHRVIHYIVKEILGLPSPMDGHDSIKNRLHSPALTKLRTISSTIKKVGLMDQPLGFDDIGQMIVNEGVSYELFPDCPEGEVQNKLPSLLNSQFGKNSEMELDDFVIRKAKKSVKRDDGKGNRTISAYSFGLLGEEGGFDVA